MTQEEFRKVMEVLRRLTAGTEWDGHVYAVGGCCRDILLGLPIKDVDLVVDLPSGGVRFATWLDAMGYTGRKVVIYESFGTAMFRLKEFPDYELECVMTRKEKYPDRNSRNPETAHGTLEEDCLRRDLTINALYYNVKEDRFEDRTGHGLDDLKDHILRTPSDPDVTFDDDPLRILRCIRFAARLGWELEPETYKGMLRNVNRLEIITMERIREELVHMLKSPRPVVAMELLRRTGAMHFVVPELEETYEMTQNKYHSGTVWEHTMAVLDGVESDKLEVRMAALLHDVGKIRTREETPDGGVHFLGHEEAGAEMVDGILRRLRFSHDFLPDVQFLVRHHMIVKQTGDKAERLRDKKLRKLMYTCGTEERFRDLMTLIDADNRAHAVGHTMPDQVPAILERAEAMKADGSAMFDYKLPLTGEDIMRIRGIGQGSAIKECLDYLLKLAFVDPRRSKDDFVKQIKSYRMICNP